MPDFSLSLFNSFKRGNQSLRNVSHNLTDTWRRSIRAVGGYWLGTADYKGERDELTEMFTDGMMREVRETVGGMMTWQGHIADMQLTIDGVQFNRSMVNAANAVRAIYTRLGDNLLTNGGGESGAWASYNGGTVTQDTTWVTEGTYSCKIVVADTQIRGAVIQAGVTILANAAYEFGVSVNVASGSWRIEVNRTDTDAQLAWDSTRGQLGEKMVRLTVPATNTYAGTVYFSITSEASAGTIYGDAAYFQLAAVRAETGWATELLSMTEFGRMESVLLEVAMVKAAADAKVQTVLKKLSWPKTIPPNEFTITEVAPDTEDKLSILFHGYAHTLANKYSLVTGTAEASTHIASMIAQCEFVTASAIQQNTLSYQIDTRAPIRIWQILKDIIEAGDASGNRWIGGVTGNRLFEYRRADTNIAYHYRKGKFYNAAGGTVEPWFADPGLLYLDDAPVGPTQITGNIEDDPRVLFISEIEMGPPDDLHPQGTLTFRHEAV